MTGEPQYLTLKQAASELQVSVPTLKRYIYAGVLLTYKTPGGQHRVRRVDLPRVLGAPPLEEMAVGTLEIEALADAIKNRVMTAMERRLARLQEEIERLECTLTVTSAFCDRSAGHTTSAARKADTAAAPRVLVLGPGCRACDRLAGVVEELIQRLGAVGVAVERVKSIDEIAEYGPIPLPALVVNDRVVLNGRLPSRGHIAQLLERELRN